MENSLYDEVFEATALTPGIWALYARRLKYAADILLEQYRQQYNKVEYGLDTIADTLTFSLNITSTLLYGMAFENILKAILIQNDPHRIHDGQLVKWRGGGHNLTTLAEDAGLHLEPQSAQMLKRLSQFVTWAGRYPVPLYGKEMFTPQSTTNDLIPPEPIQPSERVSLDSVFANLFSELKTA